MELKLKSCSIRSWTLSDAMAVQRHANNHKIWLNLRNVFPHPYSLDDSNIFLNQVINAKPETTFAIAFPTEAMG
jgi:hypothetical protein